METFASRSPRVTWPSVTAGALLIADGVTFLLFALLHSGLHVFGISEPSILPAAVVESVLCAVTIGAGIIVLSHRRPGFRAAVWAQSLSIGGVLLGIVAQLRSGGTPLNFVYHRTMLGVLIAGLLFVLIPFVRRAL